MFETSTSGWLSTGWWFQIFTMEKWAFHHCRPFQNQGSKKGPESHYLDPAWYHLCRLASENKKYLEDKICNLASNWWFFAGKSPNCCTVFWWEKRSGKYTSSTWNNWSFFGGVSRETFPPPRRAPRRCRTWLVPSIPPFKDTSSFLAERKNGRHLEADFFFRIGCFQKIRGKHPKMDGENNGKPY